MAAKNKGGAPKGNNNARRAKLWRAALERALARAVKKGDRTVERGLDPIADAVVRQAMAGEKDAWAEIANRLDGRHVTPIAGDDEVPLIPESIEVILVKPKK